MLFFSSIGLLCLGAAASATIAPQVDSEKSSSGPFVVKLALDSYSAPDSSAEWTNCIVLGGNSPPNTIQCTFTTSDAIWSARDNATGTEMKSLRFVRTSDIASITINANNDPDEPRAANVARADVQKRPVIAEPSCPILPKQKSIWAYWWLFGLVFVISFQSGLTFLESVERARRKDQKRKGLPVNVHYITTRQEVSIKDLMLYAMDDWTS